MKGFFALILSFMFGIACIGCGSKTQEHDEAEIAPRPQLEFEASQSDSAALMLADKVCAAAGGTVRLEAVLSLSFRFVLKADSGVVSSWRHDWDRRGQRYRLSGALTSGEQVLVFLNLNTQDGRAFLNGIPANDEQHQALLAMAYSRFTSDTYWLLLPFKLKDPGARLEYRGAKQIGADSFEVIRLGFIDDVGLTPENEFEIFIDPVSHMIRRWEYYEHPEARPLIAWWENEQDFNGLKLATERRLEESLRTIVFEEIVVSAGVDENLFTPPATAHSGMQ